jgi:hypothetical protein
MLRPVLGPLERKKSEKSVKLGSKSLEMLMKSAKKGEKSAENRLKKGEIEALYGHI